MLTDVLPELAVSGARTVRRVLDRRGGAELPDPDLQALLRQMRLSLDFIAAFQNDAATALRGTGLEATAFRRACTVLAETLDILVSSVPALGALAARERDAAERAARLEEAASLEARARDARQSFAGWLEVLDRPFPPVDEERLRRGLAEAAAGKAEPVHDLLTRLEAGGDL